MKNILITGGAGFIGSHLADKLIELGYNVYIIDDLSTGKKENINKRAKFIKISISSLLEWQIENYNIPIEFDAIVHLAASVGVGNIVNNAHECAKNNVESTMGILNLANSHSCQKFIFASTSEVYGRHISEYARYDEDENFEIGTISQPRWSYAASKIFDEFLVSTSGLNYVICRFFNVVGPRQPQGTMVLPSFINNAINNKDLVVYTTNGQSSIRTFTSVHDVVDILVKMIQTEDLEYDVYNVGSYNVHTIDEVAKIVKEIFDSKSNIRYVDAKKIYGENFAESACRIPNLRRLNTLFDPSKFKTLKEIIYDIQNTSILKKEKLQNLGFEAINR